MPREGPALFAFERLKAAAKVPGSIVLLIGPPGTGKTHMACELLTILAGEGTSGEYTRASDLFRAIKASYSDSSKDTETSVMRKFEGVGALLIDEISQRGETAWEDQQLWALLDHRYANNRITLATTNESAEKICGKLGPSITDRIRECGDIVECEWESYRGRA